MATRLDRLLLLLDTGSTPVIRKTAAQQLGEVQKLHPHELNNLLNKVHSYLFSSQWETRIAAGLAVEAIAKNVSQWNPAGSTFEADNDQQVAGTFSNGNVKLGNFDIRKVLVHGASLLGCHGTEYDVEEDLGIEEKEKLSQQKKQLNRRLGLEVATGVTFPNLNMVDDDDLVERQQSQYGSIQTSIKDLVEEQLVFKPNLSSREKNRAKRKARQTNRQNDGDKRNSDSDNEPALKSRKISSTPDHSTEKTNGDSVVDNTLNMDEIDEWPFEAFCELLMNNLFHPTWEKRHGAATGLREVVKLHGKGAGRCSDSPVTQLDLVNQLWLEDLAVRLVCVLALDRFGDFVTDELVAPVRESCAQALGVTLHHMSLEGIRNVMCILTQLLVQSEWEVRHGGLLGLKYLLAVRQDITESLLQYALPSIFQGIQDPSDDVRAVAASALLPVTDALVQCLPHQVDALVDSLWSILVDLDDLTSSTNSIMMLLSSLLANPAVHSNRPRHMSLTELVPRLWPFLRHNISSVRKAALKTFNTLLVRTISESLPNSFIWLLPILSDSLRHIYQRCLLEDQPEILDNVYEVWCSLLASVPNDHLVACASPFFGPWMCLMMQPPNLPFDSSLLVEIRHTSREVTTKTRPSVEAQIERRNYIGGNSHLVDSSFEKDVIVVHARRIASKLLGLLSLHVSQLGDRIYENQECSQLEMLGRLFVFYLSSKSAVQKFCTAYVIHEWASLQQPNCPCPEIVVTKLLEGLTEVVYYDEIAASFTRLQMECRSFVANLRLRGVVLDSTYSSNSVLSLDQASALSSTVYDSVRQQIRPNFLSAIDEQRSSILASVSQTGSEQQLLTNRVQCSIAAALVRLKRLPDKMNPIVRPLMDALKHEENIELQGCVANTVSCVVRLCQNKTPCPNSKIIKNLCSQLCSDPHFTPLINSDQGDSDSETGSKYVGILTLSNQQMAAESGRCRRNYSSLKRMTSSSDSSLDATETDESKKQTSIQRRGATLALTAIAKDLAADLPALVPDLWDSIVNPLKSRSSDSATDNLQTLDAKAQDLVRCLQIFEVVGPAIDPSLHNKLIECFQPLSSCLEHAYTAVRHMASRCFAMLTRPLLASTMEYIILNILPWLGASDNDIRRQGATESLALIIEQLGLDVIPYIVLLIVPVLGCMSDLNQLVRLMATNIFAMLVRLMPLDRVDNSLDVNLNESMLKQKVEDRKFLDQLLNPKSIDNYSVPVPINVELRKYQQDGVNWLAFLSRYKLHGILCDDMGLGKTLQSLCVLVGDYSSNQQRYLQTGDVDSKPLPSIVICPPTLTGHWLYEVEKLIGGDILRPLHYVGHPLERARLQKQIDKHNLVLASYDVVRNDIEFFAKIKWNYCILDEGHIIKNSKTKISKAVKQLGCNHRLILSGTPIQNNVLELWSLFDFLMPGFLGTEKQFQASFGKPILLSRDAKSSSKEQEAGALAMEALHRQVLPFLLRRLKEDVLQDLPPKIIQDYYCDLSPLQVKLYEDFSKSQAKKTVDDSVQDDAVPDAGVKKPQGAIHIFQALQYLRKVCNHPALILSHDHPEYNHVMDSLNRDSSNIHDLQHASKLVALKQLLNDCGIGISGSEADVDAPVVNQHRVLLFCQMKNMLDILENDLFKLHMPSVTYLRLDGTVPAGNRHQIVNRFNNDPSIDILLLTTHVGGLGLNLTGADTVIFFEHDWNPMKDLQAMDRAHRIGQKKVVTVYRLITRGTLEEKIMGLQKFKMNIANTVINQENYSLASMGTEQLLDLFCLDRGGKPTEKAAASTATSQQSTKTVLENLGELWDTTQYESEYDLNSFMQGLKHVS